MISPELRQSLPTSAELPCSDDTPVDNEDQNLLPNVLLFLLNLIWRDRQDWYFGVDMAIYHTTGANPRVPVLPDGFLSLGVERHKGGASRSSYVLWEEDDIPPVMVLEMVSHIPGGEYDTKLNIYARLGVLYYGIYNPNFWQRDLEEISALADRHQPFEVYKLVNGSYQLQIGEPYWMPELDLGLGRFSLDIGGEQKEALIWCDRQGQRYFTAEEQAEQQRQQAEAERQQANTERQRANAERQRAETERQRADHLAARLRELGIDPDNLS